MGHQRQGCRPCLLVLRGPLCGPWASNKKVHPWGLLSVLPGWQAWCLMQPSPYPSPIRADIICCQQVRRAQVTHPGWYSIQPSVQVTTPSTSWRRPVHVLLSMCMTSCVPVCTTCVCETQKSWAAASSSQLHDYERSEVLTGSLLIPAPGPCGSWVLLVTSHFQISLLGLTS